MTEPRPRRSPRRSGLSGLAPQIKAHWQRYRPKMAAALAKTGQLDEAVQAAADLTADAVAEAVAKGQNWHQAWEALREEWAFLPSEEDVVELGFDPAALPREGRRDHPANPEGPG